MINTTSENANSFALQLGIYILEMINSGQMNKHYRNASTVVFSMNVIHLAAFCTRIPKSAQLAYRRSLSQLLRLGSVR